MWFLSVLRQKGQKAGFPLLLALYFYNIRNGRERAYKKRLFGLFFHSRSCLFAVTALNRRPVEVFFPHETDTLDGRSLSQGVFIDGMGVTLDTPLAVFGQQYLYIQIAEERLVGHVIIQITHITIDEFPVESTL
mgnify:CR=1 FL=1